MLPALVFAIRIIELVQNGIRRVCKMLYSNLYNFKQKWMIHFSAYFAHRWFSASTNDELQKNPGSSSEEHNHSHVPITETEAEVLS
jgi:hypothetical protein